MPRPRRDDQNLKNITAMHYKILDIESRLFNHNIIQLGDETDAVEYARNETDLVRDKNPFYIQHQLNSKDLAGIHAFETLGFRFVEFRIFRYLQLSDQLINTSYSFPFGCELIGNSTANKKVLLEIAAQYGSDDRFSCDPLISDELAKKRLQLYITKSLTDFPRQFVYGLFNKQNKELLGFRTGIFSESNTVRYFYYFMKRDYQLPNYVGMLETGVLAALSQQKVTLVEAVTSGVNVQEMNDSSITQRFIVDKTMILLRKLL